MHKLLSATVLGTVLMASTALAAVPSKPVATPAPAAHTAVPAAVTQRLVFSASTKAPGYPAAERFYGAYLRQHPGLRMSTSLVALSRSNKGSVVVQFSGPGACDSTGCQTIVLMQQTNGTLKGVIETHAKSVAVGPLSAKLDKYSIQRRDIVTDGQFGKLLWAWNGGDAYVPQLSSITSIDVAPTHLRQVKDPKVRALAMDTAQVPAAQQKGTTILGGTLPGGIYVADVQTECGSLGCPFVLVRDDKVVLYRILEFHGMAVLTSNKSHGLSDIGIQDARGFTIFGYNGTDFTPIAERHGR